MPTRIRLRLDSSAAKAISQRSGVGRVRHLEVRTLWLQAKVCEKKIYVIKQDGETNTADIGTKALAAGRFAELRQGLGSRSTTSGEGIEEDQAMRVGRITGGSDEASKIGLALLTLLNYLTRATSAGECADGLDGSCKAAAKPSDEG